MLGNASKAMSRAVSTANQYKAKKEEDEAVEQSGIERNRAMAFAPQGPSQADTTPIKVDNTAMLRRYDTVRARAKADVAEQTGGQQDALKRRFAQLGNLSSGAAMKQEQMTAQKGAELQQRAMEGIDVAQSQEQQALDERAAQMEFARSERLGSQGFAEQQRIGSQAFAAVESAEGRRQQERQFNASQALSRSQFGEQMKMSAKQFALEEKIQNFNLEQAKKEANKGNLWQRFSRDASSGNWGGALSTVIDPMGYGS